VFKFVWRLCWKINVVCMSLSPFDSFQSRFVTYLLNCPRICICICINTHTPEYVEAYRCYQIILRVKHFDTNQEWCEVLPGCLLLWRQPGGDWANTWHWTERFPVFFSHSSSISPSYIYIFFLIVLLDEAIFFRNTIIYFALIMQYNYNMH
jgi:hypothetical protein